MLGHYIYRTVSIYNKTTSIFLATSQNFDQRVEIFRFQELMPKIRPTRYYKLVMSSRK